MVKKKPLLRNFLHLIISTTLILKGILKIPHHPLIGSIILCMGLVILCYFIYVMVKRSAAHHLEHLVHWFEALASLFTAYIFYTEGARYLQYVFLLAGVLFFVAIYISGRKKHA